MAISLSPHQLKQVIHTPSLTSTPLQPYSTPRQFTRVTVYDGSASDYEALSMNQTQPLLLTTSNHGFATHDDNMNLNKLTSPSRAVPDLPSWTPIRTLGNDEGSSDSVDSEVDELSTRKKTDLVMEWHGGLPTNTQATVNNTVAATRTPKSSSDAKPSKRKKVQFNGVLISTKPPPYKKHSSRTQPGPASASSAQGLSLVDALARTFNANRHTEASFPRPRHAVSRRHDDASTAAQTDVETTEAEDEQLQLNTRLAHTLSKKRLARAKAIAVSANASETNSEDAAFILQDVPQPERPVKRLKSIQYESNAALIDAALGTVEAPISWHAEIDLITRDEDFVRLAQTAQTAHAASADVQVTVGAGDPTTRSPEKDSVVPASAAVPVPVENEWRMPTYGDPKRAVLSPYLSRGAKFRQRLAATFGENATVRKDRVARPRPVDHDLYAPLDEPLDQAPNPNLSESTISVSSASTAEEGASAIPSTRVTSQSPDILPADTAGNVNRLPENHQLGDAGSVIKQTFDAGEEQISGWITALQRLVKGKVHIKEEDLETLSIVLAEVESVKDSLDESVLMTLELRESVKQLSELYEIPFGDRNKLRQRAENILHTWPSMGEPALLDVAYT